MNRKRTIKRAVLICLAISAIYHWRDIKNGAIDGFTDGFTKGYNSISTK